LEAEGRAGERLAGIQASSRLLWEGLQAIPGLATLLEVPPPAGLVSFTAEGSPEALVQALGQRGIWLRTLDDPHCLRACTHITTSEAEIDQLLEALTDLR
jgi:L-cysteine/cystine lyase